MTDSKKLPAPKHRKAKSSSAEAFRKFLNKRVDIIEESASDDDAKVVTPVATKKDKKPDQYRTDTSHRLETMLKKPDALQDRYDDLVRQLEVIQQNQEMLYQKQTKLRNALKQNR